MGLKVGCEETLPRSSADFDHGFRDIFRKSPKPRDRDGDAWLRAPAPLPGTFVSNGVPERESERSSTDLSNRKPTVQFYSNGNEFKRTLRLRRTCLLLED